LRDDALKGVADVDLSVGLVATVGDLVAVGVDCGYGNVEVGHDAVACVAHFDGPEVLAQDIGGEDCRDDLARLGGDPIVFGPL
jgi:hypothetical protein